MELSHKTISTWPSKDCMKLVWNVSVEFEIWNSNRESSFGLMLNTNCCQNRDTRTAKYIFNWWGLTSVKGPSPYMEMVQIWNSSGPEKFQNFEPPKWLEMLPKFNDDCEIAYNFPSLSLNIYDCMHALNYRSNLKPMHCFHVNCCLHKFTPINVSVAQKKQL